MIKNKKSNIIEKQSWKTIKKLIYSTKFPKEQSKQTKQLKHYRLLLASLQKPQGKFRHLHKLR